uniref:Integrin beta n=1 Tax=Latimeria chalumnae TaxID=7897 RepID=H2ZVF7_LATCH
GSEASFILQVQQLSKYPVDLYYLVDVSASMMRSLSNLESVGLALSQKMSEVSSNFRLGFGSFVDKTVSPFISVHPERLVNPCSSFEVDCIPPHGFIHVLSLTENVTEFSKVVQQQQISGNIDTPEGGFDAILQATVCQNHIGWRKEAKHLLLMMTDQTSHLALDSKLAGIVVPNDGNCHLRDNVYTKTNSMEHPSLGQLAEKLIENNINVIFAVEGLQFLWYKDLMPLLPGTFAGQLQSGALNLKELVVNAYQKLLSEVKIQVDNPNTGLYINVSAICPDGTRHPGLKGCTNVKANDQVLFNITIGMRECSIPEGEEKYIVIRPIGFNESTLIKVHSICICQHSGSAAETESWFGETSYREPNKCQNGDTSPTSDQGQFFFEKCRAHKGQPVCSGRGTCLCGKCVCQKTKLGLIYGKYCEIDNFSCSYHQGKLCAGNGECVDSECKCFSGWKGESCNCSSSLEFCKTSKLQVCNGRGTCVCGKCQCSDPRSSGPLCESCPTCNFCEKNWNCVQCHLLNNLSQTNVAQCNASCSAQVYYVDHFSECLSQGRYSTTFCFIFIITFITGLVAILIFRQILQWSNNKKSSDSYNLAAMKKEKNYFPTVCSKTVTYRRDKPEDMKIHIKVQEKLIEIHHCNF